MDDHGEGGGSESEHFRRRAGTRDGLTSLSAIGVQGTIRFSILTCCVSTNKKPRQPADDTYSPNTHVHYYCTIPARSTLKSTSLDDCGARDLSGYRRVGDTRERKHTGGRRDVLIILLSEELVAIRWVERIALVAAEERTDD